MITINGTTVTTPRKIQVEIYDVGKASDRNAEGTTLADRVAVKRNLTMEWGPLTNVEISAILTACKPMTYSVIYPDPETGTNKTITCFSGPKSAPVFSYRDSTPFWEGLKMKFNEQ